VSELAVPHSEQIIKEKVQWEKEAQKEDEGSCGETDRVEWLLQDAHEEGASEERRGGTLEGQRWIHSAVSSHFTALDLKISRETGSTVWASRQIVGRVDGTGFMRFAQKKPVQNLFCFTQRHDAPWPNGTELH
jgi:hypothetical protein